jgi:hypothetical protein
MTNQQHPITPPEELRRQWQSECPFFVISVQREDWMIDRAAQWGADQELEACCEWLKLEGHEHEHTALRAARRPKPPSEAERALERLMNLEQGTNPPGFNDYDTIRRALERLKELEEIND